MNESNNFKDIKNTQDISLNIDNENNKYNAKSPYNLNLNEAKEIDTKYIEKIEEDKITDYMNNNENNFWYKNLKIWKTFLSNDKKYVVKSYEYIIYYCHFHNTTIDSNEVTDKGYKKKISKCKARVFYNKNNKNII